MPVIWGLTIGDDGTGFVVPTYAEIREALAQRIRNLRGIANLHTEPGSEFGDVVDLETTTLDIACQGMQQAVDRTIFTFMGDTALDQFLADYLVRVQASASTVVAYPYGTAGAAIGLGTLLRTSTLGTAFATDGAVAIPAAPTVAYAFEIEDFATGAYAGQPFTVTVAGIPVIYVAGGGDNGQTVRNGLVTAINAEALITTQVAYRGGQSPTTDRWAGLVIEEGGGGPFALAVAGPLGQILAWNAVASPATCQVTGLVQAPEEALRYWSAPVGAEGVTNPDAAIVGRERETDAQFKARHQIAQRGLGGGSPDAIRAIILADPAVGGGGASFCTVEYNPTDAIDAALNLPHSVRVVVDADADGPTVALALWKGKAAGDNMNGTEAYVIQDAEGNNQDVLIDRLVDQYIGVEIEVVIGVDWPNTGTPLDQLRTDVAAYIEGLQPTSNGSAVRPNLLPISTFPNGQPRGVVNFNVRIGPGPQGGPFVWLDWYPNVEPDAELAAVILNGRQKARCDVADVAAVII
jgi:hypothetical protein